MSVDHDAIVSADLAATDQEDRVSDVIEPRAEDGRPPRRAPRRMSDRLADTWLPRAPVVVFAAVEAYALVLWMAAGQREWFYLDDWDFLAGRRLGSIRDLLRPHNEHWTTLPVLIYRMLFRTYGLRTYFPYRLVGVLTYLGLAALLFVFMRHAGVNPWIASIAASRYALFAAGAANIVRPFQLTFTGALALGLVHLILADHDGPLDRRDWFGLLAGFASLMMSGIGVPMALVVGLAVLLRRGWRLALFHTVPLGVCYSIWWLAIGRTGSVMRVGPQPRVTFNTAFNFVESGVRGAFSALGQVAGFGVLLGIVFVVGLVVAWFARGASGRRAELAAPISLFLGAIVFLAITALGRAGFGIDYARTGRYLSIASAMVLPAIAVAIDALTLQRRSLVIVAVVVLAVGIQPSVITDFGSHNEFLEGDANTKAMMLALPRDPVALKVPRTVRPETITARAVTIGWLLDGVAQHRIPAPAVNGITMRRSNNFRLSFDQEKGHVPGHNCQTVDQKMLLTLHKGDVIGLYDHAAYFVPEHREQLAGYRLQFLPHANKPIFVVRNVGGVRILPVTPPYAPRVCVTRGA